MAGSLERDLSYAQHCQSLAAKLTQHDIQFKGEIEQRLLAAELEQADVLAVPSDYEGYGIAYIEGFSAGLPCIATSSGAPPEFVREGLNGFLVNPGDIEAIAAHLSHLANHRDRLLDMSLSAREAFEQHPSWDDSFQGVRPFLENCIQQFKKSAA